jgi:hypothetical protein
MAIENTDLERRVLAHERILQTLIANLIESHPELLKKLSATFGDPVHLTRQEHDYTDTASYAEQFIRQVIWLSDADSSFDPAKRDEPSRPNTDPQEVRGSEAPVSGPAQFHVAHKAGIWRVTKDDSHYGDFLTEQGALDAASAAARDVARRRS